MAEIDSTTVFVAIIIAVISLLAYLTTRTGKESAKKVTKVDKKRIIGGPYEASEVAKHNTPHDCWIIVDGKVYDVTDYVFDHPGGDSILNNAGRDSSVGVHGPQHPPSMWDVLKLYYIGDLKV